MNAQNFRLSPLCLSIGLLALPAAAWAQQAPDAGQLLREQLAPLLQPAQPGATVDVQTPPATLTLPGGAQVQLQAISLRGHSVLTEAELLAALGPVVGQSFDLAGLRALAERISAYYHSRGFPFARAFLPPQTLSDGRLLIEIVEGRYGQVRALADDAAVAASAQPWLGRLVPGAVISSPTLERSTLVLDDLPGVEIAPLIRPGQEVGTGDLEVRVMLDRALSGEVGIDNHGNRFSGAQRLRTNLQWDSPFGFGDQLRLNLMYSNEDMWLGQVNYSIPLGTHGLRASVGYAHTYYELGQDFAALGASGTAKVASLGLTYPLLRSQRTNLTLSATWQQKEINDQQQQANTNYHKSSDVLPLSINFDHRDRFGGGAITYGSVGFGSGRIQLSPDLETQDRASGQNTRGSFQKWNVELARIQATPISGLSLFGRFSAQWANKNLDSSEGFGLGGASGVRAYPQGEASGDEGWLAQIEVRYQMGAFAPYAFYDAGRVRLNAEPAGLTVPANPNQRAIAGAGLGVRYAQGGWNFDAAVAWRTEGGDAQSDARQRDPRVWITAGYRF